jgi:hypothetical protein
VVLSQQSLDYQKAGELFSKYNAVHCSEFFIFHSLHCYGIKNIKFVKAQQAKQNVPVKEYHKRLCETNT